MLFSKSRRLICLFGLHRFLLVAPTFVPTCINFSGLSWKDQKDTFPEQQQTPPLQLCKAFALIKQRAKNMV